MTWKAVLESLAVAAALAATTAQAQEPGGRITGTITDRTAGAPIVNVAVTVVGTQLGARTDVAGKFSINNVPAGPQRIHATRIGYSPTDQLVTVTTGQTVTTNIALSAV